MTTRGSESGRLKIVYWPSQKHLGSRFVLLPLLSYCCSWIRAGRQMPSSKPTSQTRICENTKRHLWRLYTATHVRRIDWSCVYTKPDDEIWGEVVVVVESSRDLAENHTALQNIHSFWFIASQLHILEILWKFFPFIIALRYCKERCWEPDYFFVRRVSFPGWGRLCLYGIWSVLQISWQKTNRRFRNNCGIKKPSNNEICRYNKLLI